MVDVPSPGTDRVELVGLAPRNGPEGTNGDRFGPSRTGVHRSGQENSLPAA
jgi:hypothetical protein